MSQRRFTVSVYSYNPDNDTETKVGDCNSGQNLVKGGPHFNVECSPSLQGNRVKLKKMADGGQYTTLHGIAIMTNT